jgi:prepilin-type processing-associated H-X9-DG protein
MNAAIKPLSSYHPGGVNAAFADGSVRFFKDTVNDVVFRGLGTRAGREVISADSY